MKTIWFFNHYAVKPQDGVWLRTYNFAKYLIEKGYRVVVFAASTIHNSDKNIITDNAPFVEDASAGILFVYIKAREYSGNGLRRALNMIDYYRGLPRAYRDFGKPDVIIGSSVHPLACVAAIKAGRRYKCPVIIEIKDLWPESIVVYSGVSQRNPLIWLLYRLEKWIYKKADRLIFTMEGGADYIKGKGWDNAVEMANVTTINNGVNLKQFDKDRETYKIEDVDLLDGSKFKVIYAGSIRHVNYLDLIVQVAEELQRRQVANVKILIYGKGDQLERLKQEVKGKNIATIVFKGAVEQKYIPYVLSCADVTLMHWKHTDIMRFGCSPNKLFQYMACGKPVLSDLLDNFSLVERYGAGISVKAQETDTLVNAILHLRGMTGEAREEMGRNARQVAEDYSYEILNKKLLAVIDEVCG